MLFKRNRILFIAPIDVNRILFELSGIIHCMNAEMPYFLLYSLGFMSFVNSLRIFLSLLLVFVSLKPGLSMQVMRPVVATLQVPVTDLYDYLCANSQAYSSYAKFL